MQPIVMKPQSSSPAQPGNVVRKARKGGRKVKRENPQKTKEQTKRARLFNPTNSSARNSKPDPFLKERGPSGEKKKKCTKTAKSVGGASYRRTLFDSHWLENGKQRTDAKISGQMNVLEGKEQSRKRMATSLKKRISPISATPLDSAPGTIPNEGQEKRQPPTPEPARTPFAGRHLAPMKVLEVAIKRHGERI